MTEMTDFGALALIFVQRIRRFLARLVKRPVKALRHVELLIENPDRSRPRNVLIAWNARRVAAQNRDKFIAELMDDVHRVIDRGFEVEVVHGFDV